MKIRNIITASFSVLILSGSPIFAMDAGSSKCEKEKAALEKHYKWLVGLRNEIKHGATKERKEYYKTSLDTFTERASEFERNYHSAWDNKSACSNHHKGNHRDNIRHRY